MNSEHLRPAASAAVPLRGVLAGLTLAILATAACTPPSTDDSNAGEPVESATDAVPEEPTPQVSQLDALLDRLGEPPLAGNCAPDITTYRISRLEWERGAAAVRVYAGPGDDDRGYRSVFSEALGQAISSDGWVNERTWDRIESEFDFSDFWNIETDEFADGSVRYGFMYIEACKDGVYHHLRSRPDHHWLSRIVSLLSRTGKLQWLETGRRDYG